MLKQGNTTLIGLRLGGTDIQAVYHGAGKVYPGILRVDSGTEYGAWSYSGATRSRSATPWTQDICQNGSVGPKAYGSPSSESQTATTAYSPWSYIWATTGNSTRSRVPSTLGPTVPPLPAR